MMGQGYFNFDVPTPDGGVQYVKVPVVPHHVNAPCIGPGTLRRFEVNYIDPHAAIDMPTVRGLSFAQCDLEWETPEIPMATLGNAIGTITLDFSSLNASIEKLREAFTPHEVGFFCPRCELELFPRIQDGTHFLGCEECGKTFRFDDPLIARRMPDAGCDPLQ